MNSKACCKYVLKEFRIFVLELFKGSHRLELDVRLKLVSIWTNMTCQLSIENVKILVKETQFVEILTF